MYFFQNNSQNKNLQSSNSGEGFFYKFCKLIYDFLVLNLLILTIFVSFLSISNSLINLPASAKNSISGLPDANSVCNDGGVKGDCGFVKKTDNIATLAASIAQIMTYIIGAIAIVFILYGAFQWMIDPEKGAATGKKIIVNALIALVISVAAYGLVATVLQFLNTNSVGDSTGNSQTGTNNGANNNTGKANTNNGTNNYNNQTNSQNKPQKAENPSNNQPIQNNNPQNNQNTQVSQTKPAENPKVETPKSQNTNQTNQNLLEDPFTLPIIVPPQAPSVNK